MGYLLLAVALLAGITKGYCGKRTSSYMNGFRDSIFSNTIRMAFCVGIGLLLIFFSGDMAQLRPTAGLLCLGALSGVFTAVFVVTWLVAVKKSAYMMLDVFLMLGVLVPLIGSRLLFGEPIRLTQWLGLAVLVVATLLMCSYNNSIKEKITPIGLVLLVLSGAANGIVDLLQKVFVKTLPDCPASVFNFYTYIFAGLSLLLCYGLTAKTDAPAVPRELKTVMGYVLVMAVCLFANSYFKTLAAQRLPSILLYPLNQGASLILSTAMAAVLFREKVTVKAVLGIVTAFAGLLIINVL